MNIVLNRLEETIDATRGPYTLDGAAWGFMLEPPAQGRDDGARRIPAGRYPLELKPVGSSHFDKDAAHIAFVNGGKHLGMIRLVDVPGRSEILIHWGNYSRDTEGCLLVGLTKMQSPDGSLAIGASRDAYARLYSVLARDVANHNAWIDIRDGSGA